jgi:hypothetical protein
MNAHQEGPFSKIDASFTQVADEEKVIQRARLKRPSKRAVGNLAVRRDVVPPAVA